MLGLRFERIGADTARVRWWTQRTGEWGLRFWVVVVLEPAAFGDAADRVRGWSNASATGLRWSAGGLERCACVLGARPPLLVTSHPDLAALASEYETHGYWYLESRGAEGPLLALRYNLEEMHENCVAVGVGLDSLETAAVVDRAGAALEPVLGRAGLRTGRRTAGSGLGSP